jgi:hypothetical protein
VVAPALTGQRFRPRKLPATDALTYVRSSLRSRPTRYQVRARLAADPQTVEERFGRWVTVEPDDTGCTMTMQTDTLDWPVMVLADLDCDFTVEEPAELTELLARVARRFAAAAAAAAAR